MELIDKMAKMQKEFEDIYYQFIGVLAVSDYGVQVDDELFLQNFKEFKVEKNGYKYPIKIKKIIMAQNFLQSWVLGSWKVLKKRTQELTKK